MNVTNEDIIQAARRQRQKVHDKIKTPSISPVKREHPSPLRGGWVGSIAASLVGFFAGYALHTATPQPQPAENPVAQVIVQHDTIMQVTTVRDTIYQTRIVTKYEKPMLAGADDTPPEQKACSMLCDEIPYELLASH